MPSVLTWQDGQKVIREYDPEIDAPIEPTAEQIEAQVQRVADNLLANSDRDVAIAFATIDLAMAVRDGQADGLTREQLRGLFRDRVVAYLRERSAR